MMQTPLVRKSYILAQEWWIACLPAGVPFAGRWVMTIWIKWSYWKAQKQEGTLVTAKWSFNDNCNKYCLLTQNSAGKIFKWYKTQSIIRQMWAWWGEPPQKASIFSKLTVVINEQGQILPEVRVDVEQQSRTLAGPEAQGDVFSSQCHIRVDGERRDTVVQTKFRGLLQDVRDGRAWLKVGCNLWELGSYGIYSRLVQLLYQIWLNA